MKDNILDNVVKNLQKGKMIILTDDRSRENEGDLVIAAEFADAAAINFMAKHARGIICLSLNEQYFSKMQIPLQPRKNTDTFNAFFGVSIEAIEGVTTGVSAFDRAKTIATVLEESTNSNDISTPGHVFPLMANQHGVLARAGHTEGSIDLMSMAGLKSAAIICEIMNDDGHMAKGKDLETFAARHQIPIIPIQEIINYRSTNENHVTLNAETTIPSNKYGKLKVKVFEDQISGKNALAIYGENEINCNNAMVRVHSSCMTGDLLGSLRCDCRPQLDLSLEKIIANKGVLLYLDQEGRGIGLANKIKSYELQDTGLDTAEANLALDLPIDQRDYRIAANILKYLGINKLQLLTNNPKKIEALEQLQLEVTRLPLKTPPTAENLNYLQTKQSKLGHLLSLLEETNV